MKLNIKDKTFPQPDPFILEADGRYYIYATGMEGVNLYSSDSLDGEWNYEGVACKVEGLTEYWAPSVTFINGKYYMYFSCRKRGVFFEFMYVASSDTPKGPFINAKRLYDRFTIDSHVVQNESGLFLFYAENNKEDEKQGTRIFIDKLIDPETPANICMEIVSPSFDEEISDRNHDGGSGVWYTLEGPLYIHEGDYHYLMYSGGSYMDDTYHVGYAIAKSNETDLTKLEWVKHSKDGSFDPLLIKNSEEEGTGHNSAIKIGNQYYIIYHARDYGTAWDDRTARYKKMSVENGIIRIL